jgi:hypothetical protein
MFRVYAPIIRGIRCWVAVYGFLHRVFGWVVVLRAAAWVVCTVRMVHGTIRTVHTVTRCPGRRQEFDAAQYDARIHSLSHPLTSEVPCWSNVARDDAIAYRPRGAHSQNFRESITKCSNEAYNKITNIRQHNKYLFEYIGYMFRPINRSSSGHQKSEPKVLFRYWDLYVRTTPLDFGS